MTPGRALTILGLIGACLVAAHALSAQIWYSQPAPPPALWAAALTTLSAGLILLGRQLRHLPPRGAFPLSNQGVGSLLAGLALVGQVLVSVRSCTAGGHASDAERCLPIAGGLFGAGFLLMAGDAIARAILRRPAPRGEGDKVAAGVLRGGCVVFGILAAGVVGFAWLLLSSLGKGNWRF
jgi:hypothetical protein